MTEIIPNGTGAEVRADINTEFTKLEDVHLTSLGALDASISLLLHFDGASIVDSSAHNLGVTTSDSVILSSDQSKFGGQSASFLSSGGALMVADNSCLDFELGDFTIAGWIYPTAFNSPWNSLVSTGTWGSRGYGIHSYIDSSGFLKVDTYPSFSLATSATVTLDSWTHFEISKKNGTLRVFLNGNLENSVDASSMPFHFNYYNTYIGRVPWDTSQRFTGYMDELVLIKGEALHDSSFSVPAEPYSISSTYPSNPINGQTVFDTGLKAIKVYYNGTWY